VPLGAGEGAWADALLAARGARHDRSEALEQVLQSPFALPAGLAELERCYRGAPRAVPPFDSADAQSAPAPRRVTR
jgi:hypothetical protein